MSVTTCMRRVISARTDTGMLTSLVHLQDKPDKLAALLVDFWKRNTTTLVLPPKMGSASGRNSQPVKMVGDV